MCEAKRASNGRKERASKMNGGGGSYFGCTSTNLGGDIGRGFVDARATCAKADRRDQENSSVNREYFRVDTVGEKPQDILHGRGRLTLAKHHPNFSCKTNLARRRRGAGKA